MVEMTNEEVIYRLGILKDRGFPVELPEGCACVACREFETMGRMGLFDLIDLPHCIQVTIKRGARDINSVFALEMWKLNNADPTEV